MSELNQLRKLMEAVEPAPLKEDWGSSDWYSVINSMDKYIDQHGLSPESIMDAATDAALFWGDSMEHNTDTRQGELEAIQDCKDGWMRMSERGQALAKMFAPVDEGISEADTLGASEETYDLNVDFEDIIISNHAGEEVLVLSTDAWENLVREYNRIMRAPRY